jgi:hypothetical protein
VKRYLGLVFLMVALPLLVLLRLSGYLEHGFAGKPANLFFVAVILLSAVVAAIVGVVVLIRERSDRKQ